MRCSGVHKAKSRKDGHLFSGSNGNPAEIYVTLNCLTGFGELELKLRLHPQTYSPSCDLECFDLDLNAKNVCVQTKYNLGWNIAISPIYSNGK